MSETIQDLYTSFSEQMEPIQEDSRYFRYLFEMAQASGTTIEQQREELVKVVDEEWISMIEDSLDAINTIIENPRRFITTEEEVVPVSLAKKISADSVRHLSQNTQFLAPSDDGGVHPTRILNVNTVETYDLYENRFIYHLIQRLLTFVDKRTDVIFWSTGNEIRNRFKMHSKIDDAYEEIEYNVEMTVKNRQSFAENDADNMDVFMRIDRVRRLVMALRGASFCQIMNGCSAVRSPIQRTNLIMKDPNYRKCYQLWQFMERYDKVGYNIDVQQQALAFDDEYMVQMYTNLINNYTVFKSLTDDERNLQELESVHPEPVAPKFIKEIKEVQVDSPDLPDVEVHRVFVEEVTQAQLDAEQALAEAREQIEELQGQLKSWKVQAHALTDERDDLADELDEAKTRELALTQRAQMAEADVEELRASLEDVEAGKKAAEADAVEARSTAAAQLKQMRAETDAEVAAAHADADAKIAAAEQTAAEQVAQVKSDATAALAAKTEADAAELQAAKDAAAAELAEVREASAKELAELHAKLDAAQLQIEEASLKKETDELSKQRLAALEKEMAELRDSFNSKKAQWENEKNAVNKVQSLRAEVESTKAEIEKATRTGDYAKAGELQYGKLPTLQKQLEEEEKLAEAKKESSLLRDRVTEEEIANIVARWTGIPVSKLVEGEREKLLRLPDTLHQRVIGQDEAVQKVSDAILRSRAGIANPNRPIGSFLFLGPTGVGKTELAKALAQALFDDEKNMVRIDMTEYMEKFSVSRLIGAPPGYVGYEEGGQLTEAVRRHPYSVVLFDEVEKAHPDVFNILLQVLDDGRITDSQGRTVDFKNTVIILTSNLGSDLILEDLEKSRANGSNELSDEARNAIDQLLKRQFRPEFLNRLDDIVYYKSLTKTEIGSIVDLMLADLRKRLEDKQLKLVVTDAAKNAIIDGGYDPIYGARPLKRYIQSHVETMIAKEIIGGAHTAGDTLTVDADGNGQLILR